MKNWEPLVLCMLGGLFIGSVTQSGIGNALVGVSGAMLFYGAGYLRAKSRYDR